MTPRFSISADTAAGPFVVGLDVGSGGSRAALYDATGREVGKRHHKIEHTFTTAADGTSVIDADQVADELREALRIVLDGWHEPIAAIGVDTFASSLIAVDAAGTALTPCITYADSRCAPQVAQIAERIDVDAMHQRTGARLHTSYNTPRLAWLRETQPEIARRAVSYMALGEYVALRLLGTSALGTAAAAWGGMLDRRTGRYVPELVEAAGIDLGQLGTPMDPADTVPVAGTPLAAAVPELAEAVWVPVVGDGLTANMGIGARGPGIWGISTATSGAIRMLVEDELEVLPSGLWAYRVDAQRTLIGSAMSDCGRVLDWVRATLTLPFEPDSAQAAELLAAEAVASTPMVVPFLSGERGTKWRGSARAMIAGVGAATGPTELFRGAMEGLGLCFLRIADELRSAEGDPERIVLSGGMTNYIPAWLQVLSDALGAPVDRIDISRSTMRGSALLALEQVAPGAAIAEAPVVETYEPRPGAADHYRGRLERFEALADLA